MDEHERCIPTLEFVYHRLIFHRDTKLNDNNKNKNKMIISLYKKCYYYIILYYIIHTYNYSSK